MKKIILSLIITGVAGLLVSASAQPAPGDDNTNTPPATDQPGPPPDNGQAPVVAPGDQAPPPDNAAPEQNPPTPSVPITPSQSLNAEPMVYQSNFMPPSQPGTNAADLNLNFVNTPLDMVLNYLSDAAGFIVVQQTRINSNVRLTVSGRHLTRDEAVDLLNSVLNQNGYAAISEGRTLTIMDRNDAKTGQIPVKTGNNPEEIPVNARMVTQIIPIRFVDAQQLVSDLSSFVSPQATVVANQAGNSIVITDTQANIHHLMQIIKAVDDSAEAETEIRVFPLHYASPVDVATELGNIFPSSTSGSGSQSPIRFGGGGGGFPGGGGFFARMMANAGGGGAAGGGTSTDRIRKATQVNAVADSRIQAVIVTAPKDLMEEIASMMKELDVPSDRDQDVYVFKMNNGDAQQVATELQNMFPAPTSRGTTANSSQQTDALQTRIQNSSQTMNSQSSGSSFGGGGGGLGGGGRTGGTP